MDIIKIIKSIEELAYQIVLWFLMAPKTFIKTLKPYWVLNYVKSELEKEDKNQFETFLSPMLLWILTAVIPTFIFIKVVVSDLEIQDPSFTEIINKSLEIKILLVCLLLIVSPLTFALGFQLKEKKAISPKSLKENFFTQLYAFTPLQSLTILGLFCGTSIWGNKSFFFELTSVFYLLCGLLGGLYNGHL